MRTTSLIVLLWSLLTVQSVAQSEPIDVSEFPELSTDFLNTGDSSVLVHTGVDKKTAYFRFGNKPVGDSPWKWDVAIESPYDKDNNPSVLGDFDGLTNSTNASINFQRIGIMERGIMNPFHEALKQLCARYAGSVDDSCTAGEVKDYIEKKEIRKKICEGLSDSECNELVKKYIEQFVLRRIELQQTMVDQSIILPVRAWIFGFKGKIGVEQFKYRDMMSLEVQKNNETPWSISAYSQYVCGSTTYGGGFQYQESYKEKPEVSICTTLPMPPGATACSNGRIGPPDRNERQLAFFEIHHHKRGRAFAVAPRISFDFEKDEVGINVPIYLVRNKEGLFTGGLKIGWQSETDEVVAGFFVGKAFTNY